MLIWFYVTRGCFHPTMAELSRCDRDCKVPRAYNIYDLAEVSALPVAPSALSSYQSGSVSIFPLWWLLSSKTVFSMLLDSEISCFLIFQQHYTQLASLLLLHIFLPASMTLPSHFVLPHCPLGLHPLPSQEGCRFRKAHCIPTARTCLTQDILMPRSSSWSYAYACPHPLSSLFCTSSDILLLQGRCGASCNPACLPAWVLQVLSRGSSDHP